MHIAHRTSHIAALLMVPALGYGQTSSYPSGSAPDLSPLQAVCPDQTAGNKDFDGNGPAVTIGAQLGTSANQRDALLSVDFIAEESGNCCTTAEDNVVLPLWTPPKCLLITGWTRGQAFTWSYTDTDHDIDGVDTNSTSLLVERFEVRGDTSNDDVGRCTNDDTKYWAFFNEAQATLGPDRSTPDCVKDDGSDLDVQVVDANPVLTALNALASQVEMRLDNAATPSGLGGNPSFLPNASFIGLNAPGVGSLREDFTIQPMLSGRYAFLIDDVNLASATIEPDGGGLMLTVQFETAGVELRSLCKDMLFFPNGEFLDASGLTEQEIQDFIDRDFADWAVCDLGNELRVDLDRIEAKMRLFLEVDEATGDIRIREPNPINPTQDIWVTMEVQSQHGPCENNVFAISDDCMENDELELELPAIVADALAEALTDALDPVNQALSSSPFSEFVSQLEAAFGSLPPNLVSIFIGDTQDIDDGQVYLLSR